MSQIEAPLRIVVPESTGALAGPSLAAPEPRSGALFPSSSRCMGSVMPELKGEEGGVGRPAPSAADGLMTVAGVAPTNIGPPTASASDGVARVGVPARLVAERVACTGACCTAGSAPSWKKMPAGARGLVAELDDDNMK